jgi:FtsP/CotA-like multicopper oxidase with cupredoxin domain
MTMIIHVNGRGQMGNDPHRRWGTAYSAAYEAAQPEAAGAVVPVDLQLRESVWEFQPGRASRAWLLNGSVPGPTLEARVGDVLEIRLTNRMSEPTVLHWHGLRIPAAMDGTESVQRPVAPGESFTYRYRLQDAGTFWYHSHANEAVQLERGVYGALIVRGPDEPRLDGERVLVFDDVGLDEEGQIKPQGGWIESHDGRVGNVRLVNGRQEPALTVAAGQVERWRVINASSARYLRLSIGGRPFRIIGSDGGLIKAPVTANEVLLVPADRIDLAVGPFADGESLRIESLPYNRGAFRKSRDSELFATLHVGPSAPSRAFLAGTLRPIAPLVAGRVAATREVRLDWSLSLKHGVALV